MNPKEYTGASDFGPKKSVKKSTIIFSPFADVMMLVFMLMLLDGEWIIKGVYLTPAHVDAFL